MRVDLRRCASVVFVALGVFSAAYGGAENPSSDPYNFTPLGDLILFTARDEIHGRELWRYDPIRHEVRLVMDIMRGMEDGIPSEVGYSFPVIGSTAFFVAQNFFGGTGVWCTDGTKEGTRTILPHAWERADLMPRFSTSPPGHVLFQVFEADRWELYSSDGTRTDRLVPPCVAEIVVSKFDEARVLIHAGHGTTPYLSDGTPKGTVALDVSSDVPIHHISLGPRLSAGVVSTMGRDKNNSLCVLHTSPLRIEQLNTGGMGVSHVTGFGTRCFLQAVDRAHGPELWSTDGTATGTRLFKDIVPGPRGSDPYGLCAAGNRLFFSADDMLHGRELWVSDGTVEGTYLVKDIFEGPGDCHPYGLRDLNGQVVFGGVHDGLGEEPWVSDGTPDGTFMLNDVWPGPESSEPYHFTRIGDAVYFSATDGVNGREMWRTDGTPEGTHLVADINPPKRAIASGAPHSFVQSGDGVWFVARGRDGGARLWRSDGTRDGSGMIVRNQPLPDSVRLVHADDTSVVVAIMDDLGDTSLAEVRDGALTPLLPVGVTVADEISVAVSEGRVFFVARDAEHGEELWVLTTSPAHAALVCDIRPGSEGSSPATLRIVRESVYFSADNARDGRELWASDGTREGTFLAADIAGGEASSNPDEIVAWKDDIYVVAHDGTHGRELWRHDTASRQSTMIRDIYSADDARSTAPSQLTVCGSGLFFTARTAEHGVELWRSDGTPEGTQLVRDIAIGRVSSWPRELTGVEDVLFFSAFTPGDGHELWRSDGTANGTYQVSDILGGMAGSAPSGLTRVGERLVFVAESEVLIQGYRTRELWTLDMDGGLGLLMDIWPGPPSSEPAEITVLGNAALFRANDGAHGAELWRYDGETHTAELLKDLLPQSIQMPRRK